MADLTPGPRKPPPAELTGFRSALAHTGIPHGVLLWKPRLPSRNWLIFWSVSLSLSYAYYYDRSECKRIKQEVVERVEKYGREPMPGGSLGEPRRVVVWAGRWGGDDDADRSGRYFRKYVKPYLVAAGIDYTLPSAPLHGSITRQVHAAILLQRRQALGLAPTAMPLSLPGVLDPAEVKRREVESGVVLVGRASMKEYLEGLRRGWEGGVDEWEWEKEVEKTLEHDGVFDEPKNVADAADAAVDAAAVDSNVETATDAAVPIAAAPAAPRSSFAFLSRPSPPAPATGPGTPTPVTPARLHTPPSRLPPTPPVLLLPFTNHLGFLQLPYMILDFFNERAKVRQGAQSALALIEGPVTDMHSGDAEHWDEKSESWYNKTARQLPDRLHKARTEYYESIKSRIDLARAYENGDREMTDEEKKANKVERIQDIQAERLKKELRWRGSEEGWEIVKPETPATWRDNWEGWLKMYQVPEDAKEGL
ncbi:mitochondrial import inner membrane translocase subunit TIM54 [Cryptococcus tetragattii IND107]|uniref:Mitochondrial import inner membrane translocase subunit TIM54 n=1 Tax=Cryptococcus tetragattii IND107 TaxID=1296105 RepID=A0ABR3BJC9_9TREE|nr:mitochondrial import inner membrane translocase subunit TIM54 [Cryptococcus tetragattii IND107]